MVRSREKETAVERFLSHMIPVLPAQRAAAPVSQIRWYQQNGWLKTPELKKIPLRAAGQRTASVEKREARSVL